MKKPSWLWENTSTGKVKVAGTRKKGVLQIEFYGEEDLQNLLSELKLKEDE